MSLELGTVRAMRLLFFVSVLGGSGGRGVKAEELANQKTASGPGLFDSVGFPQHPAALIEELTSLQGDGPCSASGSFCKPVEWVHPRWTLLPCGYILTPEM